MQPAGRPLDQSMAASPSSRRWEPAVPVETHFTKAHAGGTSELNKSEDLRSPPTATPGHDAISLSRSATVWAIEPGAGRISPRLLWQSVCNNPRVYRGVWNASGHENQSRAPQLPQGSWHH